MPPHNTESSSPPHQQSNDHFEQEQAEAKLISHIRSGECVLFLGAGVHALPPKNSGFSHPPDQAPLLGGDLAATLASECGYREKFPDASDRDLQRVALWYETNPAHGRNTLIRSLRLHLDTGKTATHALRMLAELPFKIIVTTNYDSLFEKALRRIPKEPSIRIYNPTPSGATEDIEGDPSVDRPLLVKMHGDLDRPETIVITDEDYITFIQRMAEKENAHPVPQTARFRMLKWPTIFIGYSLRDYNLRLLFRTLRWKVDASVFPKSFSIDQAPDPLIWAVYQNNQKLVTFILKDLWALVPKIHSEICSTIPRP